MPSYDASRFHPPAPIAPVTLRDPNTGATVSGILMQLDIGADVTLIPRAAIEWLGVSPEVNQSFALRGFDGTESFAPVATLQVIFLRRAYGGHSMLIDGESGILGRDILNHLALLFDGPRQQWSEHLP